MSDFVNCHLKINKQYSGWSWLPVSVTHFRTQHSMRPLTSCSEFLRRNKKFLVENWTDPQPARDAGHKITASPRN
jgi:hypothetical protein